eukprot:GEMP01019195.1.p1 GENE.GEMP01019195.1~~GEMP01019195.1.p1  ORF type:complete len:456 (+),score=94.55 GEMP01019195.1:62-1429(+)
MNGPVGIISPGLNARQRKQVYMHSSIFEQGGPTTKSYYVPQNQENIYQHLHKGMKREFAPELHVPRPSDMKQTQNFGHNVVFPSRMGQPHETNETYDPSHKPQYQRRDSDRMQIIKSHHEQTEAIPREQWACPDIFLKSRDEDTHLGWKDTRNELARDHSHSRDSVSARDLKYYELSSSLFDHKRLQALNPKNGQKEAGELQSSCAHFLSEDSSLKKSDCTPHSAEERFQENLMASTESNIFPAANDHRSPSNRYGSLDEPQEDPRRRHEKNFSDIFGKAAPCPKKILVRGEATTSSNCSWLDSRAEISYRNKFPKAFLPKSPTHRKEMELQSSIFPEHELQDPADTHKMDAKAQKAELVKEEKEARSSVERASAFGRKQLNLASAAFNGVGKFDSEAIAAPNQRYEPILSATGVTDTKHKYVVNAPYAWTSSRSSVAPKELKRLSLEGSGNIIG